MIPYLTFGVQAIVTECTPIGATIQNILKPCFVLRTQHENFLLNSFYISICSTFEQVLTVHEIYMCIAVCFIFFRFGIARHA